jgi:hypothetical protein
MAGRDLAGWAMVCMAVAGCAPSIKGTSSIVSVKQAPVAVDRATCSADAILLGPMPADVDEGAARARLGVPVLDAPDEGAKSIQSLPRNSPIYLCGESGRYRGIMFPAPGQRAVCSRSEGDQSCPTGWVREPVPVEVVG